MTAVNPIAELLAAPLNPDWTIEGLTEQLLDTIATLPTGVENAYTFDAEAAQDRQAQRMIRPLLACLATMSATEAGTPPDLYGGSLRFQRIRPEGPVWIVGHFDNRPGTVRVAMRREFERSPHFGHGAMSERDLAEHSARA